jgi:hypothetical protein
MLKYLVLTCALLVVNPDASLAISRADDPSRPPVELVTTPPSGCEKIGEVSGSHYDATPRMENAKDDAMQAARKKGATHVVQIVEKTQMTGGFEWTWTGMAYRCEPPAARPAPAK